MCVLETKKDEDIGNRRHKHLILTKVKAYGQNVVKLAGFKKTLNSGAQYPVTLALCPSQWIHLLLMETCKCC